MINKAAFTLIHPFFYNESKVSSLPQCDFVANEERDDFLPYVRNFIESHGTHSEPKACCIKSEKIALLDSRKKHPIESDLIKVTMQEGKIYFFKQCVAVFTASFQFENISEEDYALHLWALSKLSKQNHFRINRQQQSNIEAPHDLTDLTPLKLKDFLYSFVCPYVVNEEAFNPFSRSNVMTYSLILVDQEYSLKPAFIESLLNSRKYTDSSISTNLPDSINNVRQSGHIETFGNLNGVVYLCRDDGTDFSRSNFFDIYGKNYMVTFLITVYQQAKLQQFIDEACDLMDVQHKTSKIKKLKDKIFSYITRTDFTQISHNPSRNLLYKFFRGNLDIRALLYEVSTIIKKIDQEIEADKNSKRVGISVVVALIVLPTYFFTMVDQLLKLPTQWLAVVISWFLTIIIVVAAWLIAFHNNRS